MVRLEQFEEKEREHLLDLPCPVYESTAFAAPVEISQARVALISTAGLHRRSDRAFGVGETGYRLIPKDIQANELVMSHISTNFDRSGFQMDMNIVFPLDRLKELERSRYIHSSAEYHYSFMGATDPTLMEQEARNLAAILKNDKVNVVLLVPV